MGEARLVYEVGPVLEFVRTHMKGMPRAEDMQAIGLERDGRLVAGVIYEGFNGHNMLMHVAAEPGARWMTRAYLHACFAYPFVQCKVNRVTGYVAASNLMARRFDEHLGFEEEARLRGAAPDGGDVIIYAMWKDRCQYVDPQ